MKQSSIGGQVGPISHLTSQFQKRTLRTKNKVKESRFKPPEQSIIEKPTPCMVNKVNTVTYDMEDFLGTCDEKRCKLAKVDRKPLGTLQPLSMRPA